MGSRSVIDFINREDIYMDDYTDDNEQVVEVGNQDNVI